MYHLAHTSTVCVCAIVQQDSANPDLESLIKTEFLLSCQAEKHPQREIRLYLPVGWKPRRESGLGGLDLPNPATE